ncbi:MAG: carboxypeptidase regulatory-like domain-containing protein [Planctomycetes bacterium]|nr:carboxypeptidase regulatory-like domain-containing protein [Planctomycetota bacterium]
MFRRVLLILVPLAVIVAVAFYSGHLGSGAEGMQPAGDFELTGLDASVPNELVGEEVQSELRSPTEQVAQQEVAPEPNPGAGALGSLGIHVRGFDVQGIAATTAFIQFAGEVEGQAGTEHEQEMRVEPMSGAGEWSGELEPGESRVRLLPPRWTQGQGAGLWQTPTRASEGRVELTLYLRPAQGTSILGVVLDKEGLKLPDIELVLRNAWTERDSVVASDDQGAYAFFGVSAGTYNIVLADGAEDDGSQMYLVDESVAPIYVVVEPSSPGVIHVRDLILSIDPTHYRIFIHPPAGTDPTKVHADVTTKMFSPGYVMPLARSADGIACWAPRPGFDDGLEQRLRVIYHDSTGRRVFRLQVLVQPGKTERVYIP